METGRQSERLWLSGRQIQSHHVRFGGDRCSSNGSAVARELFRRHSRMASGGGTMKILIKKTNSWCSNRRKRQPYAALTRVRWPALSDPMSAAAFVRILLALAFAILIAQAP